MTSRDTARGDIRWGLRGRLGAVAMSVLAAMLAMAPAHAAGGLPVRLGNNTEDVELITSGPNAGQVAVLDGWEVLAIPVSTPSRTQPRLLFDVTDVPWAAFPSGMGYVPNEKVYVFGDQGSFDDLIVVDATGHQLPSRPINYLPGAPAVFATEGIVYLNEDTAFPNTLARAVLLEDFSIAIQILRPDGTQLREIVVSGVPEEDAYILGLTYLKEGQFLIATGQGLWHVDLDGTVVDGPLAVPHVPGVEGLVTLPNGRIYAAGYSLGSLLAYDRDLVREPARDRQYPVGIGQSRSHSGFWDETTGTWMLNGFDRIDQRGTVASVSPSLNARTVLFHPPQSEFLLASGPGGTLGVGSFSQPKVDQYDRAGNVLSTLDLGSVDGVPPSFGVRALAYVESQDAYAVRLAGPGLRSNVYLVSRDGTLLRTITTPFPGALLSSVPGDGTKLLAWGIGTGPLATYDVTTGAEPSITTPDTGQVVIPFSYIAGPDGSYAIMDNNESSITVFEP